jgi:hypothetical protein
MIRDATPPKAGHGGLVPQRVEAIVYKKYLLGKIYHTIDQGL